MNNTYLKLVFSNIPLSVAIAFSSTLRDNEPFSCEIMWVTIEENFGTSRRDLILFYHITEYEFEHSIIKVDFRVK